MNSNAAALLKQYHHLEQTFRIVNCTDEYSSLVTANGNQDYPVQRWFHLKEAFSLKLLEALLTKWEIDAESVRRMLDPFCGVGTSLLAGQMLAKRCDKSDLEVVGIERNPFLKFVSETKLRWHQYEAQRVKQAAAYLLNGGTGSYDGPLPPLSTFHREDIYDTNTLRCLLAFKEAIRSQYAGQEEEKLLLLGYATVVEAVSGVRKDGRALRVVPNKRRLPVEIVLESVWDNLATDLELAEHYYRPLNGHVVLGDGRTLRADDDPLYDPGKFDLILYSPPYLNNIDYTEVYKLELWLSGFVQAEDEFRSLRFQTLRSHPSVRFRDPITITQDSRLDEVNATLDTLIQALPKDRHFSWRAELFPGYFDDMYIALKRQIEVLESGGWIFCVVGNSLHGPKDEPEARLLIAADLLIATIASRLGLEVKAIQVARYLKRRPPYSRYLRESILALHKPD